ncbi:hypothetical protein D4R75_10860 [bacterium]|nr:MAG: hypothetical protein D4R75_10860 [bacterium]
MRMTGSIGANLFAPEVNSEGTVGRYFASKLLLYVDKVKWTRSGWLTRTKPLPTKFSNSFPNPWIILPREPIINSSQFVFLNQIEFRFEASYVIVNEKQLKDTAILDIAVRDFLFVIPFQGIAMMLLYQ